MIVRKYTQDYKEGYLSPIQEKHYSPRDERKYLFATLERLRRKGYTANWRSYSADEVYRSYRKFGVTVERWVNRHTFKSYVVELRPDNWRQNKSKRSLRSQSWDNSSKNVHGRINQRSINAILPF